MTTGTALTWRTVGLVFAWSANLPVAVYQPGARHPFATIDATGQPYQPLVLQTIAARWLREAGW